MPPAGHGRVCRGPAQWTEGPQGSQSRTLDGRARVETVSRGEITGEERRDADGEVACKLVEADGKAARLGPDQIDLHDHRHRPGKPLIDAKQRIRGNDPAPTRGPYDHERDGQADKPAEDENVLAAPRIGELAGDEI